METKTINRCINETYLLCDKNKNCLQCIREENKINQRWINHDFNNQPTETDTKKIIKNVHVR